MPIIMQFKKYLDMRVSLYNETTVDENEACETFSSFVSKFALQFEEALIWFCFCY